MDDVRCAIADAWAKISPRLARDPDEIHRRLARRRSKFIESPPRAWCLAVRASDTRLARYMCSPLHRATRFPEHREEFLLDSPALKKLCAPIFLPRPGLTIVELCHLLGVPSRGGVLDARVNNVFRTH